MKTLYLTIISVFLVCGAPQALAKVAVGEALPHMLDAQDQDGISQNFQSLTGAKGAVLVFVRSVDWCPYCQKQLLDINLEYSDIKAKGYEVVSISYDDVQTLNKFDLRRKIDYPLLSDQGSEIIKAFGILNEDIQQGNKAYGIPHPTIYVVSETGEIQAVLSEEGYKDRPTLEALKNALQ